jgi:hypothetical protein
VGFFRYWERNHFALSPCSTKGLLCQPVKNLSDLIRAAFFYQNQIQLQNLSVIRLKVQVRNYKKLFGQMYFIGRGKHER